MECPLKVYESKESGTYYILDSYSCYICGDMRKETADYIVTAINSHEKSRDIIFEVARQAIAKYDINAPPLTKNRFANELVDSLDEALEAEKS